MQFEQHRLSHLRVGEASSPARTEREERMGYKQRERQRRRRKRLASNAAQTTARRSRSSARKWWLTIATRKGYCANVACGVILKEGAEVVYRHSPMETLCLRCADRAGHRYRPSVRWESAKRKAA
jgi:hypothetical protein